jgi:hypothetical protein
MGTTPGSQVRAQLAAGEIASGHIVRSYNLGAKSQALDLDS